MREHQIVVNLKAQQFEQLQKLARERGYKSVTAYVKQKVLELALGLDPEQAGTEPPLPSAGSLTDLKRIHGELKSFLDELSVPTQLTGMPGMSAKPQMAPAAPQRSALDIAPPDEDFDWSPAVATPGTGRVSFDVAQKNTFDGGAPALPQTSTSAQSSSGSNSAQAQDTGATLPQVLPSSNLGGFGFGLGMSSYGSNSARFQTPFSSGDRLSGYRDIMDDMEELADRAFAISPRLGALDENVDDQPEDTSRGGGRRRSAEFEEEPVQAQEAAQEESWDFSSIDKEEQASVLPATAPSVEPASFVAPIVPADLPGVEELAEQEHQEKFLQEQLLQAQRERDQEAELAKQQKLLAAADLAEKAAEAAPVLEQPVSQSAPEPEAALPVEPAPRRRSATAPMLPPPDEIDEKGLRTPTYVPPPAPLPPRVSQTNIPAMANPADIASSAQAGLGEFAAGEPVDVEDDLLSDLLDSNLAAAHVAHSQRDESAPNPFAVSLSFELEAAAMEEQTPIGQVAMEEEALLEETPEQAVPTTSVENTTDKAANSKTTSESEDQSANAPTFSGTPPPKRRRT